MGKPCKYHLSRVGCFILHLPTHTIAFKNIAMHVVLWFVDIVLRRGLGWVGLGIRVGGGALGVGGRYEHFFKSPIQKTPPIQNFFILPKHNILYYIIMTKKYHLHITGKAWMVLGSILPPRIWPCLYLQQNIYSQFNFTKDSNSTIRIEHGMESRDGVWSGHKKISSETCF